VLTTDEGRDAHAPPEYHLQGASKLLDIADRDGSRQDTEVEVQFIAEAPDRTRVELEHRNLDRHGPGWESERNGVATDQGWPLYLDRFAQQVNA
jgi:hypothetical protein